MKPTGFRVHMESPAPREAWAEVFTADPQSMIQQSPQWLDGVLEASGGVDVSRLYTLPDGRRLILPMVRKMPFPGVAFDGSYPASYGPGGLLADGGLQPSDVRAVLDDLCRSTALSTRLRAGHATAAVWESGLGPGVHRLPRHSHVLDLSGGFEVVEAERFTSSTRRGLRKAERSGVQVAWESGSRLVPTFYDLYLIWTLRRAGETGVPHRVASTLARRREPLKKFIALTDQLGASCRVWIAATGDEPIAGIITCRYGRHATYWRGYSRKEVAGPLRANLLLHRLAIQDACEAGCVDYDLGESGGVRSLEHFKESLGGRGVPTVDVRLERIPFTRMQQAQFALEAWAARQLARRTNASVS